ncbi:cytochrome c [Winogradskyella maritima]|uniref:C-type cytochrome n=1 Tax=Winogradskyella maritima TaxID=1517766 RepID=A0ABV8AJG1_9FLAO|nr:cytochrome c [Winogradskyella maritima]
MIKKSLIAVVSIASCVVLFLNCKNDKDLSVVSSDDAQNLKTSIARGKAVYNDFCVSCHLPNGMGVKRTYPPLAGSDYLQNKQEESIKGIKFGMKGEITVNGQTYNNVMAPMGLADDEVADVMNYINHSWGNDFGEMVTEAEVSKIKK